MNKQQNVIDKRLQMRNWDLFEKKNMVTTSEDSNTYLWEQIALWEHFYGERNNKGTRSLKLALHRNQTSIIFFRCKQISEHH